MGCSNAKGAAARARDRARAAKDATEVVPQEEKTTGATDARIVNSEEVPLSEAFPQEERKRLSVGNVTVGDTDVFSMEVTPEENQALLDIMASNILQMLPSGMEKLEPRKNRYSLGTKQIDEVLQKSFDDKAMCLESKQDDQQHFQFDSSSERVGFACKKGLKPESPNQDSFLILRFESYALYGVFDGHGIKGHEVSNSVKDVLPKILLSHPLFLDNPAEALLQAFQKVQHLIMVATNARHIDAYRSGTTCSLLLHVLKDNIIYVAHVGDSRVVLGRRPNENGKMVALELTNDHKPQLPGEKARIEEAGGMVVFDGGWNYRIFAKDKKDSRGKRYPGLNMSRALGDITGYTDAGISAIPDVLKRQLVPSPSALDDVRAADCPPTTNGGPPAASVDSYSISRGDKFLLLCSDGVWEFLSSEEAVQEVAAFEPSQADSAAQQLATLAWRRWIHHMDGQVVDDITAVVVYL